LDWKEPKAALLAALQRVEEPKAAMLAALQRTSRRWLLFFGLPFVSFVYFVVISLLSLCFLEDQPCAESQG
jgi:hypothetical protein